MISIRMLLGGLAVAMFSSFALAGVSKRSVSLEWEEVSDVTGYEIEIARVLKDGEKKKPLTFKVKGASWSAKVYPGKYEMRMRSIDDRGVAGDWSEPSDLWVKLPAAGLISPEDGVQVKTGEAEKYDVTFKWNAVAGARGYRLDVLDSKNQVIETKDVDELSTTLTLPVAAQYSWRVSPLMEEEKAVGEVSDKPRRLALIGKKLAPPAPDKPDTKFVTEVKWSKPEFAQNFSYALLRKSKDGKWQVADRKTDVTEPGLKIDTHKPGGRYKLQVKATGELREASDTAAMEFYVYEGTRTPAAIENAMLREAIEKEDSNYFIASYLLSNIQYEGVNKEAGKKVKYDVLGGTGRIGYGYMPKGKWGFVGIADMSGVLISSKNYLYGSIETQAMWRAYISTVTQFRAFGGLFLRQTPEAKGQSATEVEVKNITHTGPMAGVQLWHPFSYKFGMQLNAQVYYSAVGLSTPTGGALVPTMSYQAGAMGTYKFQQNITCLAGYAYRVDHVSYKAMPHDDTSSEANFAEPGDVNEASLTGHYLNLYIEVGF